MQINYTGRNVEITAALKEFTEEKMQRLSHRDSHIEKLNVTFHIENITHTAEGTVRLNGIDLHATANANDMYTAIDALVDKLLSQITKHKEKLTSHHGKDS